MFRKVLYLMGALFLLTIVAFFYREATHISDFVKNNPHAGKQKIALLRFEDVNPGTYDDQDKLGKLRAIADYLYSEGVPFQVGLIPYYKDPKNNIEISLGDVNNPHVKDFIATIKYMHEKGGLIGLHGYTHQYLSDVTAVGYEFMDKGPAAFASPAYAEKRVKKSLELAEKAGIPIDFWETPHYTAAPEQYQLMSNYFGFMYEPNPRDKQSKNISSWDSTGLSNQGVIFVPAPLLNVNVEKDVNRILGQLDKNDPEMLASFFFHPFQEFRFMYKMKAPEGYEFYVHETDSYLHRLVNGFKEKGYTFITVNDLIRFLPAQRLDAFSNNSEKVLLAGDFDGNGRADLLAENLKTGSFYVVKSNIDRAIPRNNPASWGSTEEWLKGWINGNKQEFVAGDFNGDGLCDIAAIDKTDGTIRVALSDGKKFIPQDKPWGVLPVPSGKFFVGDFNGDKKGDILFWNPVENTWKVMLSKGNGFSEPVTWLSGWEQGKDVNVVVGDFNGDGKKDVAVVEKDTGTWRVAFSNGSSLVPSGGGTDGGIWLEHFAAGNQQVAVGNFNGSGTEGIAAYDNTSGKWAFASSTGSEFVPDDEWPVIWGKDEKAHLLVGDFNGDGKSDLAVERYFGSKSVVDLALSVMNMKKTK